MSKILENQPARNPSPAWVGQYIAAGLDLIPLRNWNAVRYDAERKADVKVGKAPLLKDWRGVVSMAPENAEHHMRNGGNIGVRLGHDWIVLDFDKRNLPEADRANPSAALKRFADAFGIDLKRYPLVRTGNGVHIYMRKPSDLTVAGVVRDWPGFDVKKHGGYVVAAGSMHPDTGAMYVHDERTPTFADAPEAPPRFLDHLKVKPPSGASAEPGEGHFGAHDVDRIAAMLAGLDPVQFGRGRHGDWFGVMCSTHFLSGGAAEDAFVAWCRRDPAYDSDDHESSVRARWNSLHTEGASATNRFGLYRELRHAGRDDLVPAPVVSDETDAEADAAALAQTAVKAKSTADIVKALGGWSAVADTILRRRFTRGGVVTLVLRDGKFFEWRDGRYEPFADEELDRAIDDHLPKAIPVSKTAAAELRRIIRSRCFAKRPAPSWINPQPGDPDPADIVPVRNGLLHVPTARLLAHTPRFFSLNVLPFDYEPDAPKPREFLKVLHRQLGDDPGAIDALQEWFGYNLVPAYPFHIFAVIQGATGSGKSLVGKVLTAFVGAANVSAPTVRTLSGEFGLQSSRAKMAIIMPDADLRRTPPSLAETIKIVSGGDAQDINLKGVAHAAAELLTAKLTIVTNYIPTFNEYSGALLRRMLVFSFAHSVPEDQRDPDLEARIIGAELPGLLNWALDGRRRLFERGRFAPSANMRAKASEFTSTALSEFIAEECILDRGSSVETKALSAAFDIYCEEHGHERLSPVEFGRLLRALHPEVRKDKPPSRTSTGRRRENRPYKYFGIRLAGAQYPLASSSDNFDIEEELRLK